MHRRTFIETSVAAVVVTSGSSALWGAPVHKINKVGLQLYTVRAEMKDDLDGTIASVARIGYKEVEFAGYYKKTPKEVRTILDQNGLTSPSTHIPVETLENSLPETIETAHVIGHKFIVCPWVETKNRNADGWKHLVESFNHIGEETQKAGIQFAYHNHSFEFQPTEGLGGKLPFDFLLAQTDPTKVKIEMDLCWITVADQDPLAYFSKFPGRFPLVHVKDWSKEATGKDYSEAVGHAVTGHMTNVGNGSIDWKKIFAQSEKAGIQHYFVENDDAKSIDDPKESYEYLSKLTF